MELKLIWVPMKLGATMPLGKISNTQEAGWRDTSGDGEMRKEQYKVPVPDVLIF